MPLPENTNYEEMGQGIDRITEILKRQAQPAAASPYGAQAVNLPANIINMIEYSTPKGGNFAQNVQNYVQNDQNQALNQQKAILDTYQMKLRMGDAQAKALDDKLSLFTGNDPEGKALFLQALHDDPDQIDPSNSYQVMTKLASIKKRTGYESPDLQFAKAKDQADLDLKHAQTRRIMSETDKANKEAENIGKGILPPETVFKNENTLRDEFNTISKDFRTVQDAYSKIKQTSDSGAGDMSMLYAYVKLLDPGSVVRESEFATAAASGSFGEQVQGAAKSILAGGRLPPSQRTEFLNEAERLYQGQKLGYDRISNVYTDIAKRKGLDPQNIITNYAEQAPVTPGSHPLDKYMKK